MRREQFNLEFTHVAWINAGTDPEMPTLRVVFDGDESALDRRLRDTAGNRLDAKSVDVTVRLQGESDDESARGVIAVTNRVTGDYVLECNVDPNEMLEFIVAGRRYGKQTDGAARYRVAIGVPEKSLETYEKQTLLVYSEDGELLREQSLIPSGVEI